MYLKSIALALLVLQAANKAHSTELPTNSSSTEAAPSSSSSEAAPSSSSSEAAPSSTSSEAAPSSTSSEAAPSSSSSEAAPSSSSSEAAPSSSSSEAAPTGKPEGGLSCYVCNGDFESECQTNPKQKNFAHVCSDAVLVTETPLSKALFGYFGARAATDYHCISYVNSKGKLKRIVRDCKPKTTKCDAILQEEKEKGWDASECKTCEQDLCNSSTAIRAGVYSLLLCVFATILFARQ